MAAWRGAPGLGLLLLCLLPVPALGEDCRAYLDPHSKVQPAKSCPSFCCGDCTRRYCCSNSLFRFDEEQQLMCNLLDGRYEANGVCTVGSKDKSKHLNGKNLQRDLSAPYKALSGIYFKACNLLLK
ncbi:SHSA4 protein, partial [Asarcornis scutulata]|nr:SHSA4 protein [Asarcornis scutulata]